MGNVNTTNAAYQHWEDIYLSNVSMKHWPFIPDFLDELRPAHQQRQTSEHYVSVEPNVPEQINQQRITFGGKQAELSIY